MAKMDREFLVPYLKDICALYYARNKVSSVRSNEESRLYRIENEPSPPTPTYPDLQMLPIASIFAVILGVFGMLACGALAILFFFVYPNFITIILGIVFGFIALMFISMISEHYDTIKSVRDSNAAKEKRYQDECASLGDRKKRWNERQGLIPSKKSEIAFLNKEEERITALLQKVYSINIIPKQYRDFYTAVYLYDFFESSYEDDISVALGLYALEQIKEKLDIIISNQSEMLLNQYTILSEMQQAREEQAEHNRRMQSKVDSMQSSIDGMQSSMDDISRSQRIVESNSDTAAFFMQATYFQNL